jgi:hypothetical protein
MCLNMPNGTTKCEQYLVDSLSDGTGCRSKAKHIGMRVKDQIKEIGGSMEEYRVHCIAIDNQGYNIDHSFKITYNIL